MADALGVPRPDPIEYMAEVAAAGADYKQQVLASLDLKPGCVVLDVGCGPGMDLASMADAVTVSGRVIGVDVDPAMVEAARARLDGHPQVEILLGDGHALPVDDASVDRARMDRALQHVAEPSVVLGELLRVLRPGGLLRIAEPDWDSLVVDPGDLETNRAFNRFVCSNVVRNATIGRQLARLARAAGFEIETVRAATTVFHDFASADKILAFTRNTERAIRAGALDREAGERWLADLRRGDFLAAPLMFLLAARKPW